MRAIAKSSKEKVTSRFASKVQLETPKGDHDKFWKLDLLRSLDNRVRLEI